MKLEESLLATCGVNLKPPEAPNCGHVLAYTDGSCPNNRSSLLKTRPGWGFVVSPVLYDPSPHPLPTAQWIASHGKVRTSPDAPEYAGAEVFSNNTAELQSITRTVRLYSKSFTFF